MDIVTKNIIQNASRIVVIGLPAAGKTTFVDSLSSAPWFAMKYQVFHSDNYQDHGYEQSLYVMMRDVRAAHAQGNPFLIEGVQSYRFLRKNQELKEVPIDLVIEVVAPLHVREERYTKRGTTLNHGFDKNLQKVLADYANGMGSSILPRPKNLTINGY